MRPSSARSNNAFAYFAVLSLPESRFGYSTRTLLTLSGLRFLYAPFLYTPLSLGKYGLIMPAQIPCSGALRPQASFTHASGRIRFSVEAHSPQGI